MGFDLNTFIPKLGMIYIPMLLALCVHEAAHALMAKWRGDNTAERLGRLTLNPAAHIDPMGTVVLPLSLMALNVPVFFGWAKPVPFDPRNLSNPRVDSFWIALAGPLSNVLLALLGTVILALTVRVFALPIDPQAMQTFIVYFIMINLFLAVFNMIPVHPLDGGKVLARFLPLRWNNFLEEHERTISFVLLFAILLGGARFLAVPVQWMASILIGLAVGGA